VVRFDIPLLFCVIAAISYGELIRAFRSFHEFQSLIAIPALVEVLSKSPKNTPSIAEGLDGDEFGIVGASPTINSGYKVI
jgi:hypothetical protein